MLGPERRNQGTRQNSGGFASTERHPVETLLPGEEDRSIRPPRGGDNDGREGRNRESSASLRGDPLQLDAVPHESDPLSVRGKDGIRRILRTGDRPHNDVIRAPHVELRRPSRGLGGEDEPCAIWGERHLRRHLKVAEVDLEARDRGGRPRRSIFSEGEPICAEHHGGDQQQAHGHSGAHIGKPRGGPTRIPSLTQVTQARHVGLNRRRLLRPAICEPFIPKGPCELLGGLEAVGGELLERFGQRGRDVRWDRLAHVGHQARFLGDDPHEDGLRRGTCVRRIPSEHFVEHARERVHIGAGAQIPVRGGLLRAHVMRGPQAEPGLGHSPTAGGRHREGDPEVRDHGVPLVQEDVLGLDVAVNHVVPVGIVEGTRDGFRQGHGILHGKLALPIETIPK